MSSMIVFPGQGSQFVGMGEGLFEAFPEIAAIADRVLGYSIADLCLNDPDGCLNQTQYTQPALFTVSVLHYLLHYRQRQSDTSADSTVDYLAGHSLGEYAALYAAGAFDFETGLKMVQKRGELMANAPKGAMAAVLNLDLAQVTQLLADSDFDQIDLANINTANQIVISGEQQQIYAADKLFSDAGARYVLLKVSAGFHSRLMSPVAEAFAAYLQGFELAELKIAVISNVTGRPYPLRDYAGLLKRQIDHSVKWHESISWALQQDCEDIEEVGPGLVLTKMTTLIKKTPLVLADDATAASGKKPQPVFMFAGQGSHYKNMGRQLYTDNPLFKQHFDACNEIVMAQTGISMVAALYHPRSPVAFDDVRISHPALVCFQYALARTLIDLGVEPVALVGHSLGEYVAAAVAGCLDIEQALALVIHQAHLLAGQTVKGSMMVVLLPPERYAQQADDFSGVYFGGSNYHKSFIISGEAQAMETCAEKLKQQQVIHVKLPVGIAFHSPLIEPAKAAFSDTADGLTFSAPKLPLYSCCSDGGPGGRRIDTLGSAHLWRAISAEMDFCGAIDDFPGDDDTLFVDLSPSGSLSAFIKHQFAGRLRHTFVLNQFGHDNHSMAGALAALGIATDDGENQPTGDGK